MSENFQNIRGGNPKRHLPRRLTLATDSNDATKVYAGEIHRRLQIYKVTKKKTNHFMYMDDIKIFTKK